MPTTVYVAISSTDRTGLAVPGVSGATYAASFTSIDTCLANATYGYHDISAATGTDEIIHYHCYKDGSPYTVTSEISLTAANYSSTAANHVFFECAQGEGHGDVPGTGVVIQRTVSNAANMHTIKVMDYNTASGLEFKMTGAVDRQASTVACYNNGLVYGVIGRSVSAGSEATAFLSAGDSLVLAGVIHSCLAYESEYGFGSRQFNGACKLLNNAALNCTKYGFRTFLQTSNQVVRNNVSVNAGISDFQLTAGGGSNSWDNNASSDATVQGTNPQININPATEFENAAGNNPHLGAGSTALLDNGFDVSGDGVDLDIDLQPWDAFTDPVTYSYSIGCDQPGAFTVPINITCLDAETLTPIVGVDVYIKATAGGPLADGAEIAAGTTDALGEVSFTPEYTAPQPFLAQGRKGTVSPFYREGKIVGEIGGDGYTSNIYMISDEG